MHEILVAVLRDGLVLSAGLIVAAHIVSTRRSAAATIAWLVVVALVPVIGVPAYLLLGTRKLPDRQLPDDPLGLLHARRLAKLPAVSEPVDEYHDIERMVVALGGPPPRPDGQWFPVDWERAWDELATAIAGARHRVWIEVFIFGRGPAGRALLALLTERARAGVDVRLLVDGLGGFGLQRLAGPLREAGGHLVYDQPLLRIQRPSRLNLRNHRKLVVVDDVVFGGGMNLADEYLGPGPREDRWRDLIFRVEGSAVADYVALFIRDWARASGERLVDDRAAPQAGRGRSQLVPAGPEFPEDPLFSLLSVATHRAARRIVVVTPYFVPGEVLLDALRLALARGVEVELITPRRSNHRVADLVRAGVLKELVDRGLVLRFHPRMVHAKAVIFDDRVALAGSANFDVRSLLLLREVMLMMREPQSVARLTAWIDRLRQECLEPVTDLGPPSIFDRALRLLTPVI